MEDLAANSRQFSTALLQKQMKATSQVLILMTQTLNFVQTAGRTVWFRAALPLYPLSRSFFFRKHWECAFVVLFVFMCPRISTLATNDRFFFFKLGSGCCAIVGYLAVIMIGINW